jgi:tripartite ATP-independent transporter DctP family solute receptor
VVENGKSPQYTPGVDFLEYINLEVCMKKRMLLSIFVALVLVGTVFAGGAQEASQGPMTLKIGYGVPATSVAGKYVQKWADAVTEETNGRLKFEIYPSGQLGSLVEMLEACDLNTLDITFNDASLMLTYVPEIALLSQPMLIKDYEHMDKVVQGEVGQELARRVDEQTNMHVLGWVRNGFRNIISKRPLNSLEDCKGFIIRSPESDIYIDTFTLLGMAPTPIPYSEIYTALQTGVVEGAETSFEQFILASFYELATYVLESNHMAASMSLIINKDTWNSIPESDRKIMEDLYAEIFAQCNEEVAAAEQGFKQQLKDLGCTFSQFEDQDEIVNIFMNYWSKFAKKNNCEDLLQEVIALR